MKKNVRVSLFNFEITNSWTYFAGCRRREYLFSFFPLTFNVHVRKLLHIPGDFISNYIYTEVSNAMLLWDLQEQKRLKNVANPLGGVRKLSWRLSPRRFY